MELAQSFHISKAGHVILCSFDLIAKEGNEKFILLNFIPQKLHPLLGLETFHFGGLKKIRIYASKI